MARTTQPAGAKKTLSDATLTDLKFKRIGRINTDAEGKKLSFVDVVEGEHRTHRGVVYLWIIEPRGRDSTYWVVAYVGQTQETIGDRFKTSGNGLNAVIQEATSGEEVLSIKTGQVLAHLIKREKMSQNEVTVWVRLCDPLSIEGVPERQSSLCLSEEPIFIDHFDPLWNFGGARRFYNKLPADQRAHFA